MGVDNLRVAWEACPADCTPLVVGDLNIWFEDSPNNRADALSTCWRRSTPPISPTIFSLDDAASSGDGRAGPSACGGGGCGTTHNQIIFWEMSASQRGSGGWRFAHHGSTTWTIGQSLQPSGGGAHVGSSHTNATNSASLLSFPKGRRLNTQRRSVVLLQSASNLSCASGTGMTGSLTRHGPWLNSGRPCGKSENCFVQGGRQTKCLIWDSLPNDRVSHTKGIGDMIEADLAKGNLQEAFCLLKG